MEANWQAHMTWNIVVGCATHDVQNSLKWAAQQHLADPASALSDLYISIESIRNSYAHITSAIPEFLDKYL
eukprot:9972649-Karenia_brevis.AAC.1